MPNVKFFTLGVAAALILAGAAGWYFKDSLPASLTALFIPEEAVATVNGERIAKKEYDQRLAYSSAQPQLQAVSEEEQKQQIVDQLVNEEILFQEAQSKGFTASEEEVSTQIDQIMQSFETTEEFQQALVEEGMTQEQLRANISRQTILNKYVEDVRSKQDINVTDEEISAFYDQAIVGQEETAPPLEEVQDQIQQQLSDQKLNDIILKRIAELREEADVKILI